VDVDPVPPRCLPQLISCQATEITPFGATRREIQSSPDRSPRSAEASAGRPGWVAVNRLSGVTMPSAQCGRSVL
jgi:hypothetical protein